MIYEEQEKNPTQECYGCGKSIPSGFKYCDKCYDKLSE